jgi:serine/threonine-protein kinase
MRLSNFGKTDGPSLHETLVLFRQARQTPDEGIAVAALLARDAIVPLPDELALEVSRALLDRGDAGHAMAILGRARIPSARILSADLHEEAGNFAQALALVEKVLLADYEYPGAKERLLRLRGHLGISAAPVVRSHGGATMASERPKAPFTIVSEAGRGGAATLFTAVDSVLERQVALKAFHRGARDRVAVLHEAHMTSQLAGPGVIRVFDASPDDGWIALELATGGSLRAWLDQKDPRLLDVSVWLDPLAATLARVHAAGFVHLDLKPSNVLFLDDSSRVPTLSDFGSARKSGEPAGSGSLGYVSPERRSSRPAHSDDDIYGFGRLVEDTLAAFSDAMPPLLLQSLTHLACACLAPSTTRPKDGQELAELLSASP